MARQVLCPVCGVRHPVEPKGQALSEHRRRLFLASRKLLNQWSRIINPRGKQ